mgnify:CR=1 FL=1
MKLENYEVHLPSYSIGNAIYDKIGPVCESYGRTVLIIGGKRLLQLHLTKLKKLYLTRHLKLSVSNFMEMTVQTKLLIYFVHYLYIVKLTWYLV